MGSISQLERWVDIANFGIVIALGLSFVCGGASIYMSRRLNKLKDAQSIVERTASDLRIEETKASAARANEETVRLSQDDARLRTDLEEARADARFRQTELAIEQQNLAKAHTSLAEAERKSAESQLALENTLAEVRRSQAPRTLTPAQRVRLIEILKKSPKGEIDITCIMGDGEGNAFATEIDGLLKAAGWTVTGGGVTQAVYSGGNPRGAGILVRNASTAPAYAATLQQAFQEIGLPVPAAEVPDLPEGIVKLVVGNKP